MPAVLLLAVVPISGCASRAAVLTTAAGHPALTDRQYSAARTIVRHELHNKNGTDSTLKVATAEVRRGKVTDPNVGHRCLSGRLLHIEIIGTFPHIAVSGLAAEPGSTSAPESTTVHGVLIDADAKSGRPCQLSVKTGVVRRDPNATVVTGG